MVTQSCFIIEVNEILDAQEQEELMALSQVFLDWEQKTINTAQKQANESPVLRQLTPRVGEVKPDLLSRVQELSLAQVEALGDAL
jgi:hypothetical protein